METVVKIIEEAGPLAPGFHLSIENEPFMRLVIEDLETVGPRGWPNLSVAHYGEQNGDAMRDPEMLFERRTEGKRMCLVPYYYRNDYAAVEQYSMWMESGTLFVEARLAREHQAFARVWDRNLRDQGFLEAFRRQSLRSETPGGSQRALFDQERR